MAQNMVVTMQNQQATTVQQTIAAVASAMSAQQGQTTHQLTSMMQNLMSHLATTSGEQNQNMIQMVIRELRRPRDPNAHGPNDPEI